MINTVITIEKEFSAVGILFIAERQFVVEETLFECAKYFTVSVSTNQYKQLLNFWLQFRLLTLRTEMLLVFRHVGVFPL